MNKRKRIRELNKEIEKFMDTYDLSSTETPSLGEYIIDKLSYGRMDDFIRDLATELKHELFAATAIERAIKKIIAERAE